jgi:hypothetical protein
MVINGPFGRRLSLSDGSARVRLIVACAMAALCGGGSLAAVGAWGSVDTTPPNSTLGTPERLEPAVPGWDPVNNPDHAATDAANAIGQAAPPSDLGEEPEPCDGTDPAARLEAALAAAPPGATHIVVRCSLATE